MKLTKIPFQPGIDKEGTEYTAGYSWYDCDKIRFQKGYPEKIGGWVNYASGNSFYGIARDLHNYQSAGGIRYLMVGTTQKLYVETGGTYSDVTPIRNTTAAGDVTFSATNGSTTLDVSDTDHGAVSGDWVTFSGAATLGGNVTAIELNKEYQVTTIVDNDNYEVEMDVTANASDTGNGGASVVGEYQINIGLNAYVASVGWGFGPYSSGTWGGSSSFSVANQLRLWSLDNFGDDAVSNVRGGGIYYWDESVGAGTRAVALPDLGGSDEAPVAALQVLVSDVDRHIIAFGSNPIGSSTIDPLFVRWSDREDAAVWRPSVTNSAGGTRLSGGSVFIGALQTRQEILIWTDNTIHSMRFSGAPFTFDFNVISEGVSLISPRAMTSVGDTVFFMDSGGFYVYDGGVQRLPCMVNDFVFENINYSQVFKIFSYTNYDHTEVTWHYPVGVASEECTRYVTYNYQEKVWTVGTLTRGAWVNPISQQFPIGGTAIQADTAASNKLFFHENGYNDEDDNGITAYIESGDMEVEDGDSFIFVGTVVPDLMWAGTGGSLDITIKGERYPSESSPTLDSGTITQAAATNKLDVRARARSVKMRFESTGADFTWRLGNIRARIRADGRR
jgi:hypothetical protein